MNKKVSFWKNIEDRIERYKRKYLIFSILFLSLSLVYGLFFCQFGIDFTDTFFHLNNSQFFGNPEYQSGLVFISQGITSFLLRVFDGEIYPFRVATGILYNLIIFLPLFFLQYKIRLVSYFSLATAVIIVFATIQSYIFSYDVLSVFFLGVLTSVLIIFYQKRNPWLGFIMGLLTAILIGTKFTMILVLGVIFILLVILFLSEDKFGRRNIAKTFVIFFGVFIVSYLALIYLSFQSFNEFLSQLLPQNNESHGLKILVLNYIRDFIKVLKYLGFIILCLGIYRMAANKKFKIVSFSITGILTFLILLVFIFDIKGTSYNWNLRLFLTSLFFAPLISFVFDKEGKLTVKEIYIIISFLAFSILPAVGSNTGLLKTAYVFLFFPFIFTFFKIPNKQFFIFLLLLLLPFVILERFKQTYEDGPVFSLTDKFNHQELRNIKSNELRVDFINLVTEKADSVLSTGQEIIFYGKTAHVFNYLYKKPLLFKTFWMKLSDQSEANVLEEIINYNKPVVFIVPQYPGENIELFNPKEDQIIKSILKHGYCIKPYGDFAIFSHKNSIRK